MPKLITFILIVLMSVSYSPLLQADTDAEEAAKNGLQAVTVFIDISRLNRKNGAAKKLTESHQEFAQYGYMLLGVSIYTENGDLEGFFVSYRKSDAN